MKIIGNKSIIIVVTVAAITVSAIAIYEYYWLSSLYRTSRDSMKRSISSAMLIAEIGSDKTVSLLMKNNDGNGAKYLGRMPKDGKEESNIVVSIPHASYAIKAGNIAGIAIGKREVNNLDAALYDSLLTVQLKNSGLNITHAVKVFKDSALVSENGTDGISSLLKTETISQQKTLQKGVEYQFISAPLSRYSLRQMAGIICISAIILLILILAFAFIIKTLLKQSELEKMKTDFASNMTHELKTPIAVANAANDALTLYGFGDDPQKRAEYLAITREQLLKLSSMVEHMLSTTMEKRNSPPLQIAELPIKETLDKIVDETLISTPKPCRIKIEVSPVDLRARMDKKLMSSVISTLLDNAIKYSVSAPEIVISACRSDGDIHITVKDNGPGIAKEYQKHIFDKFYRVPTGNVHDVKGYGIGLYFAKSIVERHSGAIRVDSTPGKGSKFKISIPDSL